MAKGTLSKCVWGVGCDMGRFLLPFFILFSWASSSVQARAAGCADRAAFLAFRLEGLTDAAAAHAASAGPSGLGSSLVAEEPLDGTNDGEAAAATARSGLARAPSALLSFQRHGVLAKGQNAKGRAKGRRLGAVEAILAKQQNHEAQFVASKVDPSSLPRPLVPFLTPSLPPSLPNFRPPFAPFLSAF